MPKAVLIMMSLKEKFISSEGDIKWNLFLLKRNECLLSMGGAVLQQEKREEKNENQVFSFHLPFPGQNDSALMAFSHPSGGIYQIGKELSWQRE